MDEEDIKALTEHLNSQGCSQHEISQIIARVTELDRQMIHQSVFDSIASGSFNIGAIVDEVRAKNDEAEDDANATEL